MFVSTDKRHNALTKNSSAHSNNYKIQTHGTQTINFSSPMILIKGQQF